jgi:hypothetical protein
MEIGNLHLISLINPLHVECMTATRDLIDKFGAGMLKIGTLYSSLADSVKQETLTYKIILKQELTEEKATADHARDVSFTGIRATVKTARLHFDPETVSAANRIMILLDNYNYPTPVAKLPYDAETAALDNVVDDLRGKYAADAAKVGISAWVEQLAAQNKHFKSLAMASNEESAGKPEISMREARKATDRAYHAVVKRINALIEVEGEAAYAAFVKEMNSLIKHYNDVLAQHQGRNKKNDENKGE